MERSDNQEAAYSRMSNFTLRPEAPFADPNDHLTATSRRGPRFAATSSIEFVRPAEKDLRKQPSYFSDCEEAPLQANVSLRYTHTGSHIRLVKGTL